MASYISKAGSQLLIRLLTWNVSSQTAAAYRFQPGDAERLVEALASFNAMMTRV